MLYSFRETLQYFWKCFGYWLYRFFDIPTVGEYYIQRNVVNPYCARIVKVLDKYEGTVEFKYLKSEDYKKDSRNIANHILFSRVYKWVNKDNIKRFLKDTTFDEISPLFQIDDYDVYYIDKYWYIIIKDTEIDLDNSPKYLALSIALINHDL